MYIRRNTVRFANDLFNFISLYLFVFTFAMKLKDTDYKSHWNILVFCDVWKMMSVPLFELTLVIKLRGFHFESHWNTLIFFEKNIYYVRFEFVPWKNVWFFFFMFIVRVHFSHKTDQFWFSKPLKYFNSFLSKKWCQIGICLVKHCLIWFNFCCLSIILAISWEVQILNFIKIVQLRNMLSDQNCSGLVCLICIFWHYYRNSFQLKKFLIYNILKYFHKNFVFEELYNFFWL